MKYIVVPAEVLIDITQETLNRLHLAFRYSTDKSKVIMKVANYELLFPSAVTLPVMNEDEIVEVVYPYNIYEGKELEELLISDEWTNKEELL